MNMFEEKIKEVYGMDVIVKTVGVHDRPELKGFITSNKGDYTIYINANYDFKDSNDVLGVLIHEGRHLWQKKNGYMKEVKTTKSINFSVYHNHPLEVDARWAVEEYFKGNVSKLKELSFDLDTSLFLVMFYNMAFCCWRRCHLNESLQIKTKQKYIMEVFVMNKKKFKKKTILKKGGTIEEINAIFKDALKNKSASSMTLDEFAALDEDMELDGDNIAADIDSVKPIAALSVEESLFRLAGL